FFQAEDGIRDRNVTGVQTCALPIYELETGEKLWEYEDEKMKAPPVAKDDVVYFSNVKGFVHALDAETGEHLDKKELGGTLAPSGPIIINDTLIIGSQDSNVYAVPLDEFETS